MPLLRGIPPDYWSLGFTVAPAGTGMSPSNNGSAVLSIQRHNRVRRSCNVGA